MSWKIVRTKGKIRKDHTHSDSLGSSDFDVPLEHGWVHETQLEGGNGHRGRDSAKVEDGLVLEKDEIVERIDTVAERVERHLTEHPHCPVVQLARTVERVHLFWSLVAISRPHLLWPEVSLLVAVLSEVTEDVGLLKEEAHRVGEDKLVG